MSLTGLSVLDETIHATDAWLHAIGPRRGGGDRRKACRLRRTMPKPIGAPRDDAPPG